MAPLKAAIVDAGSMGPGDVSLEPLIACFDDCAVYDQSARDELVPRLADREAVVTNKVVIDAELMDRLPRLELIVVTATGTNNIDLEAARARGVAVTNAVGYGTPSVAQHTLALMLALATRLTDYYASVRAGDWQRHPHFCMLGYPIQELAGRTLGIVGYGELGQSVARLAEAFGLEPRIGLRPGQKPRADDGVRRVPFEQLLSEADVLSLHCLLSAETERMINAQTLALMKPGALFVNTARGGLVDEAALAAALKSGRLGGAAVDVLGQEPPREGSPLLAEALPNLIVTPHNAWGSREARERLIAQTVEVVHAYREGRSKNRLT